MSGLQPDAAPEDADWPIISALLDELLDLPADARAARLAELAARQPAQAARLEKLLRPLTAMDRQGFLSAAPAAPLLLGARSGQTLGAYTLLRLLGEGGMGAVWLAERSDGRYRAQVAIKMLRGRGGSAQAQARFEREGRLLARLDHPHIARLLDAGIDPESGQHYLVIEYVDGLPLDQWCARQQADIAARLALFGDVLDAVAHAHDRLVLYRDIKPGNILVNAQGQVKLLDFGIARLVVEAGDESDVDELTRLGGAAYTPYYAAPEQAQDGEATPATDVYALGVLLYMLLGGGHPTARDGATPLQQLRRLVEDPPPPLSQAVLRAGGPQAARQARALRGDIDTLLAKALQKRPVDRYRNASAMADDLRRHQQHQPLLARPDSAAYRTRRFLRRHWLPVGAATAVALALSVGTVLALRQADRATRARDQTEELLSYMLGDLRDKLQPLGKLDLLDGVGQRAAAHYMAEDPAELDLESLHHQARAWQLLGELSWARGRLAQSRSEYEAALRSSALALKHSPEGFDELVLHADSLLGLANLGSEDGSSREADQIYDQSTALRRRALALRPQDVTVRMVLASGLNDQAATWAESGDTRRALPQFLEALQLLEPLAQRSPPPAGLLNLIMGARTWAANSLGRQGDDAAAVALLALQPATYAAAQQAGRNSRDLDVTYARSLSRASTSLIALNRLEEAQRKSREAVAMMETTVQQDPSNMEIRRFLLFDEINLGDLLLLQKQPEAAAARAPRIRALMHDLAEVRQTEVLVRWQAWPRALVFLGQMPQANADDARALAEFLNDASAELARPEPDSVLLSRRENLVHAGLVLGDLLQRLGRGDAAARQRWQQALAVLPPADGTQPKLLGLQVRAWLRLGQRDRALALFARWPSALAAHPWTLALQRELGLPASTAGPAR